MLYLKLSPRVFKETIKNSKSLDKKLVFSFNKVRETVHSNILVCGVFGTGGSSISSPNKIVHAALCPLLKFEAIMKLN